MARLPHGESAPEHEPPTGARPGRRAARAEPVQEYFSIGDVCTLTDLKPHVLRYWESQFRILSPAKNRSGNRVYARREVELVLLVKHLLYSEKYTIDGARQKLDADRRAGELARAARDALAFETLVLMERELRDIAEVLAGRLPPGGRGEPASDAAVGQGGAASSRMTLDTATIAAPTRGTESASLVEPDVTGDRG